MLGNKKVVCVIPARLKSTRFPKKILALLHDKPLIEWVWIAANRSPIFDTVVCAIDAEETAEVIQKFRGVFYMTSEHCFTGTDRLVELKKQGIVEGDIWVNWQADEPFISNTMIENLLQSAEHDGADVWTLKKRLYSDAAELSPDICKVVCNQRDEALYFSRSPIPYYRDLGEKEKKYYKHIGLYAYADAAIEKIACMTPCDIERAESLEQLRFLFYGLKIKVHETQEETIGIDLPEHIRKAEQFLSKQN